MNIYEPRCDIEETAIPELHRDSGKWDEIEREADHLLSEAEEIAAEYDREIDTDSDTGDPVS